MQLKNKPKISIKFQIVKLFLIAFVLFLLFSYSNNETDNQTFALANSAFLYEGDSLVGVANNARADELTKTQEKKAEQVSSDNGTTIENTNLSTKVVNTPTLIDFNVDDQEQISVIDYAKQHTKVLEEGYTLTIDGKYKYYVQDEETIKWAIEKILLAYLPDQSYLDYYQSTGKFKSYTEGDKTYTGISTTSDITVTEGYTTGSEYIENREDLLFDLFHKDQNKEYSYISDTKSIKSIKDSSDMSDITFKLNNPTLSEDTVTYNGQKVLTNNLDPVIEIVQTFETTKTEDVDYDVIKEVDEDMLVGQSEVETEGKVGEKEITYENKMVNGKVVSTSKIGEEVTKKPVHEVLKVGNAEVVNDVTTGSGVTTGSSGDISDTTGQDLIASTESSDGFIWPSSSKTVTCEYMCYTNHTGIDIQSYYGGPEYAAKAGTVTTSGWSNYGYGYYVIIDHGGGVQTLYAHQKQQPPVSVGQYVEQGDVVGFEGATGNVTGEHLHFEVRINGSTVNPRGYIS